jgi:hypothetical protein
MSAGVSTYSGNPSTSPKDEVRFLVGDTGPNFALNDNEVNYEINLVYPPPGNAPPSGNFLPASNCAQAIAALYKTFVDKSVGDLRISYSQMAKQFEAISVRLRSRAAIAAVPTYFGGINLADKVANDLNNSVVQTAVKIDGMDFDWPLHPPSGAGLGPGPGESEV